MTTMRTPTGIRRFDAKTAISATSGATISGANANATALKHWSSVRSLWRVSRVPRNTTNETTAALTARRLPRRSDSKISRATKLPGDMPFAARTKRSIVSESAIPDPTTMSTPARPKCSRASDLAKERGRKIDRRTSPRNQASSPVDSTGGDYGKPSTRFRNKEHKKATPVSGGRPRFRLQASLSGLDERDRQRRSPNSIAQSTESEPSAVPPSVEGVIDRLGRLPAVCEV